MKIKQYIVTYNNNVLLERCLRSMKAATHEITIIDNFGNCDVDTFGLNVTIIKNSLRPPFSTGHLARDWNAGLILGFKNLTAPDADIVILNQNDVIFKDDYVNKLIKLHERYDFIQMGSGDEMMSFTPMAVKRIGLFDERFCNIGFQEADYLLRARIYHPERSTITDTIHDRIHNPLPKFESVIEEVECGHVRGEESTNKSAHYHITSQSVFYFKWKTEPVFELDRNWSKSNWGKRPVGFDFNTLRPTTSHIFYPYFEKHIETLEEQNFVHAFKEW
jgi:hypothetical protein